MNGQHDYGIPMGIPQVFKWYARIFSVLFFAFVLSIPMSHAQVKVADGGNVGVKFEANAADATEALEVNGKIKVNELSGISNFLIGLDGNQVNGGVLSSLGIGIGLLVENGMLTIDPDQLGGNGWALDGNDIEGGEFIGTLNENPLVIAIDEDPKYEFDEHGRMVPINTHVKIGANIGFEDSEIQTSDNVFVGNGISTVRNGSYNNVFGKDAFKGEPATDFPILNRGLINNESYNNVMGFEAGYYIGELSKFNNYIGTRAGAGGYFNEESGAYESNDGIFNNFIGFEAGFQNTSGDKNIFIGEKAGYSNTSGNFNNFLGSYAGYNNIEGAENLFMGTSAGFYSHGDENIYIGGAAGYGFGSNETDIASRNIFLGASAGYRITTGSYNHFIGFRSGRENKSGRSNCFLGDGAGRENTTGSYNVFIGGYEETEDSYPLDNLGAGGFNTAGNKNVALGVASDFAAIDYTNSSVIGYGAIVNANNKIRLGNTAVTIVESQVGFWEASDQRFKKEISENIPGLDFVTRLRPVSYKFDTEEFDLHLMQEMSEKRKEERIANVDYIESKNKIRTGFLAQEVEQVCNDINYNFGGVYTPDPNNPTDNYSLSYSKFVVPLVQAVKEQQVMIEDLEKENSDQGDLIKDLIKRIEKLEQK